MFLDKGDEPRVHLIDVDQKGIVAVRCVDLVQFGVGKLVGHHGDFRSGVETITADADNQSRLLYRLERCVDRTALAPDVVAVHGRDQRQIGVCIEAGDELVSLVP